LDDILDISGDAQTLGKPVGADLLQGILTLPTIIILKEEGPHSQRLKTLIESRFLNSEEDLHEAIGIIRDNGGIEKALQVSERYISKAKEQLKYLPNNSITQNMAKLADHINKRDV
jgi:heptaprenyl diphosphate synthase